MILVTGANGFLGRNLVGELHRRGYRIRAMVLAGGLPGELESKVAETVHGDVLDRDLVQRAAGGCEAVIHAAAVTSIWPSRNELQRRINVGGTANVIRGAQKAGVRRVVYVGSASSFGYGTKEDPGDETREYRSGIYGLDYFDSKYEAQTLVRRAAERGDLPAVIVNPTYMFGPGDAKPGPGLLILGVYHQRIPGGATGGRNYASVKDVAVGIANALERGTVGECYILGNENLSYGELFSKISGVIGRPASGLAFPAWLAKAAGLAGSIYGRLFKVMPPVSLAMVKLAMSGHYYTAGKAVRVLEMPQRPVETAIEEAFAWFRDKGYLDIAILRRSLRARPQPRRTRARGFAAKAT